MTEHSYSICLELQYSNLHENVSTRFLPSNILTYPLLEMIHRGERESIETFTAQNDKQVIEIKKSNAAFIEKLKARFKHNPAAMTDNRKLMKKCINTR
jgi:hypothetical protein